LVAFLIAAASVLAVAAVAVFAVSQGRLRQAAETPLPVAATRSAALATADPLPAFSLPALGGGVMSAADLRGKPAVVNFFASWCSSCWAEIPHIQGAFQDYKRRGLQVVGIGVLDSEDSLRWMVNKLHITYPTVYDTSGDTVVKILQLRSMPTTLFVDRQGIVRARWQGFLDEETLRRLIAQII
jgi:peroxiredoxin